jgi:hypothetical protein
LRFLLNISQAEGVQRDELASLMREGAHPDTWELVRRRIITDYVFKVGAELGMIVFLEADSEDVAREIAEGLPVMGSGLVTYRLDPISPIATF